MVSVNHKLDYVRARDIGTDFGSRSLIH
jgi:hypothetical protein